MYADLDQAMTLAMKIAGMDIDSSKATFTPHQTKEQDLLERVAQLEAQVQCLRMNGSINS